MAVRLFTGISLDCFFVEFRSYVFAIQEPALNIPCILAPTDEEWQGKFNDILICDDLIWTEKHGLVVDLMIGREVIDRGFFRQGLVLI